MNRILKKWLPSVVAIIVTIIVLFYCIFARGEVKVTRYLSLAVCVLLSAALPILNDRFKLGLPFWLICTMLFHFVLSIDFGTVLTFFETILWWDLVSHGLFGFWSAAVCLYLYKRFSDGKTGAFALVGIFLSVMGLAALWEIYEYLAGALLNEDMQHVQESLDLGKSPLYDTMTDIMIAAVGIAVYYLGLAVSRLFRIKNESITQTK